MLYAKFLDKKTQLGTLSGFKPLFMPDTLFDFQKRVVDWSVTKGRSAMFADCGLGKTPMQLTWAENVTRKKKKPVVILTPLAVASQTLSEANKFDIEASRVKDGVAKRGINICNYDRLHQLNPADYAGCVCDESSILKSFDGAMRLEITEFMKKMEFRLLCSATAAPNDYTELGTSSEALGELGYMDMLMRFFKNDQNTIRPMVYRQRGKNFAALDEGAKWRFKGHAETPFWQWTCSWALSFRRPSDLGFSDDGFILPELIERDHIVKTNSLPDGMLFALPAVGLAEQREERRRSINERCERAAELASVHDASVAWCHLNPEGDLLERLIPDCVQVSGRDSEEAKEEKLIAFQTGQVKRLVTKSKIAGWGLNWQHCSHMTTFPSHSYEQYYQSVRRFLRFGQKNPVKVDIVTTEGEASVLENLQRKSKAADRMFTALVEQMHHSQSINRSINFTEKESVPAWL